MQADAATQATRPMKRPNPTILVVDDDENDLLLIQAAFRAIATASRIHTVTSGVQAVDYLAGNGEFADRSIYDYPDFVITDLKMANGDGFSVLEHFKRNPGWAVIPTVILSGSEDNDDIKRAYLLGASSYHVKPSSSLALRVLVKTLVEYWGLCEIPEMDRSGRLIPTDNKHKLGHRFERVTQMEGP